MAHFYSMTEQKTILKRALLLNQNIVNLLTNTGNNVLEFEDAKTGSKSPAAELIKTHFYIPGATTIDKNFITMRSQVVHIDTDVVKNTMLTVYVICNEDQMDLLQGSRADLIADEIDQILNNGDSTLFGLGDISLGQAEEVKFNDGYYGWEIPYTTHVFNRRPALIG